MHRIEGALRGPNACPLCGDRNGGAESQALPNLYSEQLAALLGCDESLLLSVVTNRLCETCGLWYKPRWFRSGVLEALFKERVPDHPKGWDAVSDRFSENGFTRELERYRRSLEDGHVEDCARSRRTLCSVVDSVVGLDAGLRQRLGSAIDQADMPLLDSLRPMLVGSFEEPAAFKRFSGFSSRLLWDWMESHIGPVLHYGEVGCPLWGQLMRANADRSVRRWYFDRPEDNYWGSGCRQRGQHCSQRLTCETGVAISTWPPAADVQLDALGVFQYLDHLEAPNAFAAEVFAQSRALLLILDDGQAPSAIQHVSGWDDRPVQWLARAHGKRVRSDFEAIRGSGNRAWLLCDD